jgi:hypothetical protein
MTPTIARVRRVMAGCWRVRGQSVGRLRSDPSARQPSPARVGPSQRITAPTVACGCRRRRRGAVPRCASPPRSATGGPPTRQRTDHSGSESHARRGPSPARRRHAPSAASWSSVVGGFAGRTRRSGCRTSPPAGWQRGWSRAGGVGPSCHCRATLAAGLPIVNAHAAVIAPAYERSSGILRRDPAAQRHARQNSSSTLDIVSTVRRMGSHTRETNR